MYQQDEESKNESHVYVQTPDGKEVSVIAEKQHSDLKPEQAMQTAENIPTKSSGEVNSAE